MDPELVTVFVPCLIDQVYPAMGSALVGILRHFGYQVQYEPRITCCGQPAFNAGHQDEAQQVARTLLEFLPEQGSLVCPSGSCTAMIRNFYGRLFEGAPEARAAAAVGKRVFEFSEFMQQRGLISRIRAEGHGRVAFHNSCHSLRELGIEQAPLELLRQVQGVQLIGVDAPHACCGFGGLFSIKFAAIATGMSQTRLEAFAEHGIDTLVSNDPGCILQLRRQLSEQSFGFEVLHLTEFLARAMGLVA